MALKPVYDSTEHAGRKAQRDVGADYQQNLSADIGLCRGYVEKLLQIESQKGADSKGN